MLLNYHIHRFILVSLCVGDLVLWSLSSARVAGWSTTSACNTGTTQTQPHQISNTQRTENKTTDVEIQQHSRKLLMTDILMSETCWPHKKWNKIASDINLVFYSSTITMMHGPINIRITGTSHVDPYTFLIISRFISFYNEKCFRQKVVEKIKTH
jgi:hypothetical protein